MSYNIFSGISQQFFHTIPSDLDLITTTPAREGIFKYLSQIGFAKFPEFILDILIKVEGHTVLDVTDGQGDEKQDILTLNPKGERCLTQCKHTINYKSHYTGDELDSLVAACLRKNCKEGIFVTNSDLTPQGKRYVTDKEYNRGFNNPQDYRKIEYWNGFKIWDKIKNNSDIINKWFSNLGQVHGLRSFKFDITVQLLPLSNEIDSRDAFEKIMESLSSKSWVTEIIEGIQYEALISNEYRIKLNRWFQFSGGLDINFILPDNNLNFFNHPLYALTIEVEMKIENKIFSPSQVKKEIITKIADEILSTPNERHWWHITASQLKSFIYLHDISEPREIILASASTFVKTNTCPTSSELSYCMLSNEHFKLTDNEDDSIWIHEITGIQIVQLFSQKMHPVEQYNNQIQQYQQLNEISTHNFYAIENIDSQMMMRIRRILSPEWIAFQDNYRSIIWAIKPSYDEKLVKNIFNKLEKIGLTIKLIEKADIPILLNNVQKDLIPSDWTLISDINKISFPVILNKRVFWLSKEIMINTPVDEAKLIKLLEFKYSYENKFGFDYMEGKNDQKLNSLEITNILYDFFTFRGKRMIDIGFKKDSISFNIRFSEGRLDSSNTIALSYLDGFNNVYEEVKKIVN